MMLDSEEHACLHCVHTCLWVSCVFTGVGADLCRRTLLGPVMGAMHTSAGRCSHRGSANIHPMLVKFWWS